MKLLLSVLSIGLLCGCAGIKNGAPPRLNFEDKLAANLAKKYAKDLPTDEVTVQQRNQVINDLVFLTDIAFNKFITDLHQNRATFDTVTDLALLGLGGAGTLVGGESTKAILAAISAGVAGSRISIEKNYFRMATTDALIAAMEAHRKTKLAEIREGMTLDSAEYPLSMGISQIGDYYRAGTLIGALEQISADSGATKATAEVRLKAIRPRK